jgi:WhiB family redox-sensing transcriptional regulator
MMPGWQEHALCAQVDPDLWFPEKGESSRPARLICGRCPVRTQCDAAAAAGGERYGIWGGRSYKQRLRSDARVAHERQAVSAREHIHLITSVSAREAAQMLGVSDRTIQRWRTKLAEAS